MFNPKWIVGKTIASVEMNPFDGGTGRMAHDPTIRFTDGSFIFFVTQETEVGAYGTAIGYGKPRRKKRK